MMMATQCPTAERLQALAHGRLSDEQSDELFNHVRSCEACTSELETIQDGEDSLITSLREPDELAVFDDEPDCQVAVAKALGALAKGGEATDDDLSDRLPQTIGEYEVVRPLGRGGMGTVFLARHTKLRREAALKILAGHRLADPRMRDRFDAEMRAVGKLSHPNIVTAHDAREVDGTAVLVTEYIDGFDLGELVSRIGPLAVADACEIGRQVAAALDYTSRQGFVHRDVKPSNIMLSQAGEVKLLDLGLARFQIDGDEQAEMSGAGMTGTGQTMGTADYVAPEQVTDSRSVDVRADLYSLGCTLFTLLTGRAPFTGREYSTAFAKMTAHVSQRPPSLADFLPGAPAQLIKLVESLLAKDPDKRPQSPQAVAGTLAAFADGSDLKHLVAEARTRDQRDRETAQTPAISNPQAEGKPRRRVPLSVAIAAGLLGLLVGFLCGITITIKKPDGSQISMTVPDASDIEIQPEGDGGKEPGRANTPSSAEDDDARETLMEHQSRLQGVWRVVSQHAAGSAVDVNVNEGLFFFDGGRVSTFRQGKPTEAGVFSLSHDDRDSISLIQFAVLPTGVEVRGFVKLGSEEKATLEFTSGQSRSADAGAMPMDIFPMLVELERVGDIPRTEAGVVALAEGQPEWVGQALQTYRRSRERSENASMGTFGQRFGVGEGGVDEGTDERLLGVWQVVSMNVTGRDPSRLAMVVAFERDKYHLSYGTGQVSSGEYSVDQDGERSRITLYETIEGDFAEAERRRKVGQFKFRPGGELVLQLRDIPEGVTERPQADRDDGSPFVGEVLVLEREGDIPRTMDDARKLLRGKDPGMTMAIAQLLRALPMQGSRTDSLSLRAVDAALQAALQTRSKNHLKLIGLAFHNFHDTYGSFPASAGKLEGARRVDEKEVEPFSWRVAILPFIGESELYEQYRFHEPWDSEHNQTLLSEMPEVYRSPFADPPGADDPFGGDPEPGDSEVGLTHYQGFAGKQSALGEKEGHQFRDLQDGTTNTLLIVESRASVPWTQPQDLPYEKPEDAKQAAPFKGQPLNYLMADGSVHAMDPVDWEELAKRITRAGGERVEP